MEDNSREDILSDFSPIYFPNLHEYKKTLPRRKKQRSKDECCGLSTTSWVFLLLAFVQVILVTGIQLAIVFLGRGRLDAYVDCLTESLQAIVMSPSPVDLTNTSLPTFGTDKQIYVFFFISLALYNFLLVIYALKVQNIVEVYSFMVINTLIMIYGFFQVYQFRGFGDSCDPITSVGYLALSNALLLLVFTLIFLFLSLFIYVEFGWKTYVLVDCNPAMRYYYRVYQLFMSVLKLVLLFLVIFSVGQCVLILEPTNYEFPVTILIAITAILALPVIYILVTFELILGAIAILLTGLLLVGYFSFKIFRYATRSCPLCVEQTQETEKMREVILTQIQDNSTKLDLDLLERAEDFQHLIMIAAVNMIFTVVAIIVFVHYLRQYRKGLKDYFAEKPFNKFVKKLMCRLCKRESHNIKYTTENLESINTNKLS